MNVDPLSLIEKKKMAYLEDEQGYSFSKWLAYMYDKSYLNLMNFTDLVYNSCGQR